MLPSTVLTDNLTAFGAVAGPMTALILFVLKWMIKGALAESNTDLMKQINGTYLRTAIATEKFASIEKELRGVHHRINDLKPSHE